MGICKICNNEFIKKSHNQIYCSKECSYTIVREKARKNIHINCAICNKEIIKDSGLKKYCSEKCFIEGRKLRNRKNKKINCPECGNEFLKQDNQKFCSKECTRASFNRNRKKNTERICVECEKSFIVEKGNSQTCSKECSKNHRKYLKSNEYKNLHTDFENKIQHDKEYYQKNSVVLKERIKLNHYNRLKEDSEYRLLCSLRSRVGSALKNNRKADRTIKLTGCTLKELQNHLQRTAIENGYLDFDITNYSDKEYHVDHKISCSIFDFSKEEDQRKCFHYTNLQILKAEHNMKKHNKLHYEL